MQRCLRNRRHGGQIARTEGKNDSLTPIDPIKAWIPWRNPCPWCEGGSMVASNRDPNWKFRVSYIWAVFLGPRAEFCEPTLFTALSAFMSSSDAVGDTLAGLAAWPRPTDTTVPTGINDTVSSWVRSPSLKDHLRRATDSSARLQSRR